ncbi:MAG: phage/plasmid replication protein, II/X family [Methylococcales bacterium]|nr:phage/plasmid replication protein, II/X family [Methylococcales bacterium]
MIDWFRGEVDFFHTPLPAGHVVSIDSDGSIEWDCVKKLTVRSSFETSLKIRSVGGNGQGMATGLQIDGNLCKFLQGHNVFGSRDLNKLLLLSFRRICALLPDYFTGGSIAITEAKIKKGDYKVKMIDLNHLYDCGNDLSVESWLHAAEMRARSRHGRSSSDKGTVYLGKTSKRWAFKFYNKYREITSKLKQHRLPFELQDKGLEQFTFGKVRGELRLFAKELEERHGITHGYHLSLEKYDYLFNYYLGKIDMTAQTTLIDEQLLKLPRHLQSTYQHWSKAVDLRSLLPRPTFYRQRRELLAYGVDIAVPPEAPEKRNNVVPLIRVIEAKPVPIPQWAYDLNLIAA